MDLAFLELLGRALGHALARYFPSSLIMDPAAFPKPILVFSE